MEKKFGKLVSNVGKNAKDILEKSKNKAVQIADQNDDGKFDLEDVTAMANSVGNIVKKGARTLKETADEKARQIKHYLQLDPLRDVIEQPINDLLDINGWDLQKALRLMYKSNPTLFEWLKSPIIYIETEFADEMRRVMSDYFSVKHSLYHYISMAEGNYKKYLRTEMVKAKKYFYVLRPLLAGQWILEKESPPPMLFSELVEVELQDEVRTEVEDLLKIKIHESEIKKIPRVNRLNEYLESEIAGLREKAGKLGEEKKVSWEKLNKIFLKEV